MSPSSGWGSSTRVSRRPRHACPCCRFITLPELDKDELCPVCFWEDDGTEDPSQSSERNGLSLSAARRNFRRFGAKDWESRAFVLPPRERSRYSRS